MALSVGTIAPDFTLINSENLPFTLSKDLAGKACVLFFYPKNFTSGCTKEVCEFSERIEDFKAAGISIIGISTDDYESHARFSKQFKLPFQLLSDIDGKVSTAYGVKLPFLNISSRATFFLGSDHRIASVYKGLFQTSSHIKAMITALKSK